MELIMFAIIMLTSLMKVNADFEHVCTTNDYYYGRQPYSRHKICGSYLTEFILDRCGGMPYLGPDVYEISFHRKKRSMETVFLDDSEAHSFLRTKRGLNNRGLVCECCINACSIVEIDQYCQSKRRRRSIVNSSPAIALKNLYANVDKLSPSDTSAILTPEKVKKMQMLELNKRRNIAVKWTSMLLEQPKHDTTTRVSLSTTLTSSSSGQVGLAQILANSISLSNSQN